MFAEHQPAIAAHARDPDGFRRIVRFVLLTIQEPLSRAPAFMLRIETGDSAPLWGFKGTADKWWEHHYVTAHAICQTYADMRDTDGLVAYLSQCPGLGLAKGGFVAQLCWGLSGCLDSHNVKRYGINPNTVAARKVKRFTTARARASEYNAACDTLGGTRALWDSWCTYVADSGGYGEGLSADAVSALHCTALGLVPLGVEVPF